jgi:hypothetical protein
MTTFLYPLGQRMREGLGLRDLLLSAKPGRRSRSAHKKTATRKLDESPANKRLLGVIFL